ncbi:MAG TPA: MFS transporter [Polyangiales bacterium]|nr:MFS transporter [Polyangiales bacterium]
MSSSTAQTVQRTYLLLTLLSTLAASFIWGINTLFLLDAGLSNTEAFAANAFFTAGEMLFEIPTGVVADTWGRRTSYLLGAATLLVSTLLYLAMWQLHAPFWAWAGASMSIGLGFTFFSGATEAWLVDALAFTGHKGKLDDVLARGQVMTGIAMLTGTVGGGFLAQFTNLGVPYLVRAGLLGLTLLAAAVWMRDLGFTPQRGGRIGVQVRAVLHASIEYGFGQPAVRWLMLASFCSGGIAIYGFYAAQPYLLQLYGDPHAFGISGLSAAVVAAAQIASGFAAPYVRRLFTRRTHVLILSAVLIVGFLWAMSVVSTFVLALAVLTLWSFSMWVTVPLRQTYLNGLIPSERRATLLSFDNLMMSAGAAIGQPVLGRVADARGYAFAYFVSAIVQVVSVPFLVLARRANAASDPIARDDES